MGASLRVQLSAAGNPMKTTGSAFSRRLRAGVALRPLASESAPRPESMAKSHRLRYALPLVAAIVACPFSALSQTAAPSQVTPQTLRPAAPSTPGGLDLSGGAKLQPLAGAEGLSFIVGRLLVEGAFPELEGETRSFALAVERKRITVAQIYERANALEQEYARAGYVLVGVTVPPQKLNDGGPLRIVVVDGFIENVQVDNVP